MNGESEEQRLRTGLKEVVHCCFEVVVRGTLEVEWTAMLFELVTSFKEVAAVWPVSQMDTCEVRDEERETVSTVCPTVAVLPETWN